MNESVFQRLIETARRRELTAEERAQLETWLLRDPAARACLAEDEALSRLLSRLSPASLPPAFTAQVVAAVEREERTASSRGLVWRARFRAIGLQWRLAGAVATVAIAIMAVQLQHRAAERARLAESISALSALADLPSLDALADFDLVYSLPDGPLPDGQEFARALE